MSSFCGRPRSSQFQERQEHTFRLSTYVALPMDSIMLHLMTLFFCFYFIMKLQQKLNSFYRPKRTSVEPEKHKDGLDKDGVEAGEVSLMTSVVQSLNIIV